MTAGRLLAPAYPAAVAAAFVLAKYLDAGLPIQLGLRAALAASAVGLVIAAACGLVLHDRRRGAFVGLIVVLLLSTDSGAQRLAGATLLIGTVLADRLISWRRGRDLRLIGALYDVPPVIVAALAVLLVAQFAARGGFLAATAQSASAAASEHAVRDIWVVLLDCHPRADVVQDVYHGDMRPFVVGLEELGLDVSTHARSNYLSTELTIPSMLNMAFTKDLYDSPDGRWRVQQDSRALHVLRDHGYKTIAFGSGYTSANLRGADRFVDTGGADLYELQLLARSPLRHIVNTFAPTWAPGQVRDRVEANLAGMVELAQEPSADPRFVWVHLPAPHAPSVFTEDGVTPPVELNEWFFSDTEPGGTAADHAERYLANLEHLDRLVLEAVRVIVTTDPDDVVIVMSDHGSRSTGRILDPLSSEADIRERFATLFVARTPGHRGLFGDTVTPVNVMTELLSAYLGFSQPRLPNLSFDRDGKVVDS